MTTAPKAQVVITPSSWPISASRAAVYIAPMNPRAFGPIKQVAYVVGDLNASIQHWIDFAGVGPWTVFNNATMRGQCRGVDTAVRMNVGLSYQGDLQIELIEVTSDTRSPYQNAKGQPLLGLHHIAWHSADLDADVAKAQQRGLTPAFVASNGVVRVAYMESAAEPGLLLELIEANATVLDGFAAGMQASRDWDGTGAPITVFDLGA